MSAARSRLESRVVRMYKSGLSLKEISEKTGLSMSTIYSILKKRRVDKRKGSYKSQGRLSEDELSKILEMRGEGKTVYEIAKALGRPPSTVYYALQKLERTRRR